jgi:hypothetical protein
MEHYYSWSRSPRKRPRHLLLRARTLGPALDLGRGLVEPEEQIADAGVSFMGGSAPPGDPSLVLAPGTRARVALVERLGHLGSSNDRGGYFLEPGRDRPGSRSQPLTWWTLTFIVMV